MNITEIDSLQFFRINVVIMDVDGNHGRSFLKVKAVRAEPWMAIENVTQSFSNYYACFQGFKWAIHPLFL